MNDKEDRTREAETKPVEQKRRKLLIATDNFLPRWDGIARFLAEIIPRLKDDYEITVISPDYGISPLDLHIDRVLVPTRKKRYGDYTPAKLKPCMVREAVADAEIVFTQTIGPIGLLANHYAKRLKKPLAAYIHSIEWELVPKALDAPLLKRIAYPLTKLLTRILYNRCNLLVVPSENIADMLTWQRIMTRKRVVHLGVDTKRFTPGDKAAAKERLKLPKDSMVIGFHGRLGHEKNLLTLSRAYLKLEAKGKRLFLVGDGVPELKERLRKVRGSVVPGATNEIIPCLQAMDLYVLPSFTETTSLAVLEAMSCELPVIASPVGFIQQYIKEGENGLFFDTKSWYNLSLKLQRLADDEKLRVKLGKAARKTVMEQFNWDRTAEGIAEALRSLPKKG